MLVGMISSPRSRRCSGDGAKAVITIGRPYKFAAGRSGGRETSSRVLRRYTRRVWDTSGREHGRAGTRVDYHEKRNIDGEIIVSRCEPTREQMIIYDAGESRPRGGERLLLGGRGLRRTDTTRSRPGLSRFRVAREHDARYLVKRRRGSPSR